MIRIVWSAYNHGGKSMLRKELIDRMFALVEWPCDKEWSGLINGLREKDNDLALAIDDLANDRLAEAAKAAFLAGWRCGRNPELLVMVDDGNLTSDTHDLVKDKAR